MINTWFKFEYKIQNTSKVIVFTSNHTGDLCTGAPKLIRSDLLLEKRATVPRPIGTVFQQVRSDSCRHLLLTGMSRFLMSKPKQQDQPTVQLDL